MSAQAAAEARLQTRRRPIASAAAVVTAYSGWGLACGFGSALSVLACQSGDPRAIAALATWFAALVGWNLYLFGPETPRQPEGPPDGSCELSPTSLARDDFHAAGVD